MELYVPADASAAPAGAQPGAAIIGRRGPRGVLVAVAGPDPRARADAYADRASRAVSLLRAGRGVTVPAETLHLVGYFNESLGVVNLRDPQAAARWVGRPLYRNDLEAADSLHNQRMGARRDLRRALTSGRPDQAAAIVARHGWPGL